MASLVSVGPAAKRRHIHSLGRQPQEHGTEKPDKPRSGDRQSEGDGCGSRRSPSLPPLQGSGISRPHLLGLTPQAIVLSRLRRSNVYLQRGDETIPWHGDCSENETTRSSVRGRIRNDGGQK